MSDGHAEDGDPLDEGNSLAHEQVVLIFLWLGGYARVVDFYLFTEFQVVILPRAASTALLVRSGSTNFLCNKVSKISKISLTLG